MRILGLDFGSKTVGVAVSDGLLLTAQGVETIERKDENKLRKTCARIEELIAEYEITEIVLGLPKNMNNTEESASKRQKLSEKCWSAVPDFRCITGMNVSRPLLRNRS